MCKYTDGSLMLVEDKSKSLLEIIPDSYFARGEFEIISEEDKEIDIQSIEELAIRPYLGISSVCEDIENKINELIKAIKQLDKKMK